MQRITAIARAFQGDRRGLAAVEFALIVPLMLTILFGTIEVTNGVSVNRKVDLVSRTISDLTSRAPSVQSTDIANLFTIGAAIMQTYPKDPLKATVTQVLIDPATGAGRVQWSQATPGATAKKTNDPVIVPTGLIAKDPSGNVLANQYLILSEVSYLYTPAVGYFLKTGVTLSASNFTRPRRSSCVQFPTSCAP